MKKLLAMALFTPSTFLSLLTIISLVSAAFSNTTVVLPIPSGPYEVGSTTFELIDYSRTNAPFINDSSPRALILSIYYPVAASECSSTYLEEYMPKPVSDYEDQEWAIDSFPQLDLTAVKNKFCTARADRDIDLPIVLFSPGWGLTRLFYSAILQSVTKAGYIVVAIDHPYDVDVVQFPDGSVIDGIDPDTCSDENVPCTTAVAIRVLDTNFVLDQLATNNSITRAIFKQKDSVGFNVSSVGIFGHSLGGATALAAMVNDSRIAGGLNLDGSLFEPAEDEGTNRPFLQFGHTNHSRDSDDTWHEAWPKLTGWKLELSLNNSRHLSFSDIPYVLSVLDLYTADLQSHFGELDGVRGHKVIRAYVVAFFDFVLKGVESSLLEALSDAYPEITFILGDD